MKRRTVQRRRGNVLVLTAFLMTAMIALLAFDLGVLHRRARTLEVRESLWLSAAYIFRDEATRLFGSH